MRILHHWPLDPWSRQVRLALAEKKLDFEVEYQRFWDMPDDLVALNPTGLPPVLVEETEKGRTALCEIKGGDDGSGIGLARGPSLLGHAVRERDERLGARHAQRAEMVGRA